LQPLAIDGGKFDSVAINYLLHCVPGDFRSKAVVFDHLTQCMNPGAVIFGSTLLNDGVNRSWPARRLMKIYNAKGVFANTADTLEQLDSEMRARFRDVQIHCRGAAALFAGRL
jgi:hypothetical protein